MFSMIYFRWGRIILGFSIFLFDFSFSTTSINHGIDESGKLSNFMFVENLDIGSINISIPEISGALAQNSTAETTANPSSNVHFVPTNTQPTIWERYRRTTDVHPLRRADILFFISIPFTILWTDFWVQRFRDISVIGAYFEGVRGRYNLRNSNFTYNHETYPSSVDDPYYVFKWVNAVIWPLIIVSNDFLERVSDPVKWEREKQEMIENRFHLNLIYLPTH